jgi:hemoglobin
MRPSVFEAAGGSEAFARLAAAHHARCLDDDLLNHPFSRHVKPDHVERLGAYWAQVFGGPATFSAAYGGQSGMLTPHAGCEAPDEIGERFLDCFVAAADDAAVPDEPELRQVLRDYMIWAVADVMSYSPRDSVVPDSLAVPQWSWDGLER